MIYYHITLDVQLEMVSALTKSLLRAAAFGDLKDAVFAFLGVIMRFFEKLHGLTRCVLLFLRCSPRRPSGISQGFALSILRIRYLVPRTYVWYCFSSRCYR